jgi:hypothetical protein
MNHSITVIVLEVISDLQSFTDCCISEKTRASQTVASVKRLSSMLMMVGRNGKFTDFHNCIKWPYSLRRIPTFQQRLDIIWRKPARA